MSGEPFDAARIGRAAHPKTEGRNHGDADLRWPPNRSVLTVYCEKSLSFEQEYVLRKPLEPRDVTAPSPFGGIVGHCCGAKVASGLAF